MNDIVKVQARIPQPNSPSQLEFVKCTNLGQIAKCGRRWGKTVALAIKGVLAFLGTCNACLGEGCKFCKGTGRVNPTRVLYAAPTAEQVGKYWYEVTNALEEAVVSGYFKKDETEKFIELPGTEQRIKAKTAWNANSLRGDWGGLLEFDEFHLMNEDIWDVVGQPMLLDKNGTAIFAFTPPSLVDEGVSKAKDPRHASKMYKRYSQDKTGEWATFHFTSYDNPDLSKEALKRISNNMSLDAYRREILAEDDEIESSWLVYSKFNDTIRKIKRFEIPKTWPIITGHDFGTANPACLFVSQVKLPLPEGAPKEMRYGDYVVFKEYSPGAGFSATQQIETFKSWTKDYKIEQSIGGNVTTEEQIRQLYGQLGWPISLPNLTKVNVQIDRVISLFETNKLWIFEDLYGLLSQISNCMWELDDEKKTTNKIKDEAKYHLLACLRYLASYLPIERPFSRGERDLVRVRVY